MALVLTKDVWLNCIFGLLSVKDLIRLSITCSRLQALAQSRLTSMPWKRLMRHELHEKCLIKAAKVNETELMQICLKKTWFGQYVVECAYFKACKAGHLKAVQVLDDYISTVVWNTERQSNTRYKCVEKAFLKLATFSLTFPVQHKVGALIAAYKGHTHIIKYLMETHRVDSSCKELILIGAASGGMTSIFKQYYFGEISSHIYPLLLQKAILSKHPHKRIIIDMLLDHVPNYYGALQAACECGDKELIDLFLEKGCQSITGAFIALARTGNLDLMIWMMQKQLPAPNWDYVLRTAFVNGHSHVCDFALQNGAAQILKGPAPTDWNFFV